MWLAGCQLLPPPPPRHPIAWAAVRLSWQWSGPVPNPLSWVGGGRSGLGGGVCTGPMKKENTKNSQNLRINYVYTQILCCTFYSRSNCKRLVMFLLHKHLYKKNRPELNSCEAGAADCPGDLAAHGGQQRQVNRAGPTTAAEQEMFTQPALPRLRLVSLLISY